MDVLLLKWSLQDKLQTMKCSKCYRVLEDNFLFCPICGKEIDKNGGIDDQELGDFEEQRKKTLDVLERVIEKLEICGKVGIGSSLVSSGANIVSSVLWLTVPTAPVAAFADVVASGLGIANVGGSVLTAMAENGLLYEANEVCKLDHLLMSRMKSLQPVIVSGRRLYHAAFMKKYNDYKEMRKSGKFEDCSFRPTPKEASISMLANFGEFLANAIRMYKGNYSLVASSIKEQRDALLAEYEGIKKCK